MIFNVGWLGGIGPLGTLGLIVMGIVYVMLKLLDGPIPTRFRYAVLYITFLLAVVFLGALLFIGMPHGHESSGPALQAVESTLSENHSLPPVRSAN